MSDKPKIAIIDNDLTFVNSLQTLFQNKYEIVIFSRGDAFLEKLDDHTFATILISRNLPELDGVQTLLQMKILEKLQGVPIIMFSSSRWSDEAITNAMSVGATVFLTKDSIGLQTTYQVDALINLYQRYEQQYHTNTHIIHSLQHNINGWLTGVITIGSMLPMYPEWGNGPMFDKIGQMIENSFQIQKVNEDLGTLLTHPKAKTLSGVSSDLCTQTALEELAFLKQELLNHTRDLGVQCLAEEKKLTRIIYYMGMYFAKQIGPIAPIFFTNGVENGQVYLMASIKNISVEFSKAFFNNHVENVTLGTTFLAATYIRKMTENFNGILLTQQDINHSYIKVCLPMA